MPSTSTLSAPIGSDIALKRRRGRPSKTGVAPQMASGSVITTKHFLGYSLNKDANAFCIFQDFEEQRGLEHTAQTTETHIKIPASLEEKFSDADFRDEVLGYAERIRHDLGQRDNYKLHLQKEAPDHVYFSYSIDGAPTTELYIHPSRVDVSVQAFESPEEKESFQMAVAHQNFSNKAYKKWREVVRDQFLDDVISHELVKKFGSDEEQKEEARAQKVAMHGHNGAKKVIEEVLVSSEPETEIALVVVAAPVETPKEEEKPLLLEVPHTPVLTIEGGQGLVPVKEPEPTVLEAVTLEVVEKATPAPVILPPVAEVKPQEVVKVPRTRPRISVVSRPALPMVIDDATRSATPSEYIEAKKAFVAAAKVLKPFEGIFGSFRKEFQHDDFVKQVKLYRETKERYDKARLEYAVFVVTRQIATMLGAIHLDVVIQRKFLSLSFWVFQGQAMFSQTRIGHLISEERYEKYEEWLRHGTDNLDMQLEFRTLLNMVTLEGSTIAGLLGAPLGVATDRDPNQAVRIAAAASADLSVLREGLRGSFGIEACRVPEMSFSQRRTLDEMVDLSHMRDMVTMLEFHARLRGEVLSMERHHTTYCDLYTQLYEKYVSVVTNPEGTISVAHGLGREKASIALVESLLRQGKTLKEYASVKLDGMKFLEDISHQPSPENLHELSRVFALSRWQGTAMGERALHMWNYWHDKGGIEKAGMVYIELQRAETLLGALRRIVWAHGDLFPDQGEGEQKVYMTLRQVYEQMGFTVVPENPRQWLRLGNAGDRVYVDANGQIWYANTSGKEAGFLEIDEFEGFVEGTPEYVLWKMVHDGGEEMFMDYIKDFTDIFLNYYEKKIDLLPEAGRVALRHRLEGLVAKDHDSREEAEVFFRDFYHRHHKDAIEKAKE